MPSKFKKTYRRYFKKYYVKKYNRVKLDCALTVRYDNTNNTTDYVRFVEKTVAPLRFISVQSLISGPLNSSFTKLADMWSFYRFYAIGVTVTGDPTNSNGGYGGVGTVANLSNSIFMAFLPAFNPGTTQNPNNPSKELIIEQPGCKTLNPFGVTKVFYRTNTSGDWISTTTINANTYGLAICPNNSQISGVPFFSCRVTLYLQVKDRKL